MMAIAIVPLSIQGLVILWDEVLFHRKRGLPRWERIGHPIDTLLQITCLAIPLLFSFNSRALFCFTGLSIVSTLLITKDEKVHALHCCWKEHWLHSILFIIHPVVLIATAFLWARPEEHAWFIPLLRWQILLMAIFGTYQIAYWELYGARTQNQ